MLIRYKERKQIRDTVLDFSDSKFSADELMKQLAQRLRDNQAIEIVIIEKCKLYQTGAEVLCQVILEHASLKTVMFHDMQICSYPSCGSEDYFPVDLDSAVHYFCTLLKNAKINHLEITHLSFQDNTERHFEHFDMVDPVVMRDLLTQEKQPFYINEIVNSLNHNPYLQSVRFNIVDMDVSQYEQEIAANIKKRHFSEEVNSVLQGTHATAETYLFPEIFKAFALGVWVGSRIQKKR